MTGDINGELHQAALEYAQLGYQVLPVHGVTPDGTCTCGDPHVDKDGRPDRKASKHPVTWNGLKDATDDPDQIDSWWTTNPLFNIGIATGHKSGLWLLDLDRPAAHQWWADQCSQHGGEPDTYTETTPRPGRHLLFTTDRTDLANTSSKLSVGVDTKGEGGYAIVAPSRRADGQYVAETDIRDITPMPGWLDDIAPTKKEPKASVPFNPDMHTTAPNGQIEHRYQANLQAVTAASDGNRATTVFEKAAAVGSMVGAGEIDRGRAEHDLWSAVRVVQQATASHGYTDEQARRDIGNGLESGQGSPRPTTPNMAGIPSVATLDIATMPDAADFWDARPVLADIRATAEARMAGPWATLGVALVRVAMAIHPAVTLPPIVGGRASLNLFAALVGPSGGGKGAAESAGAAALNVGPVYQVGIGSGEGLVDQYARVVKDDDGDYHIVMHRNAVLFTAAEVDTLDALTSRSASTLGPILRQVFGGERIGFAYRDPAKRLHLDTHTYRAGLIVGVQPGRGRALLDDSDGGTPQRFLWLPVDNPEAPPPDQLPDHPDVHTFDPPGPVAAAATTGNTAAVDVAGPIVDEIRNARQQVLVGGHTDPLAGHRGLLRLKTAALFGLLDGRYGVNDGDWQLAETVLAMSDRTRRYVSDHLAAQQDRAAEASGRWAGVAQVAETQVVEAKTVADAAERIRGLVTADWEPTSTIVQRLSARQRDHADAAFTRLQRDGLIERHDDEYQGRPVTRWRAAQ